MRQERLKLQGWRPIRLLAGKVGEPEPRMAALVNCKSPAAKTGKKILNSTCK